MDHNQTSPKARARAFSYRSEKSVGSKDKEHIVESPAEKQRKDLFWKGTSKANPNAAMNESQPSDQAILEQSTISSLRAIQHTDNHGNIIADPDLSNPTRPRLERPLDTIRSFEKAIDKGYKRRSSMRSGSYEQGSAQSRRSSYVGGEYMRPDAGKQLANRLRAGYDSGPSPSRYSSANGGGYSGGGRPDSYMGSSPSGPPRSRYGNRQVSDSQLYSQRGQPSHGYNQSLDTTNTAMTNGSDSTGPWANSTDPSSENSSIEKGAPGLKPNGENGYGYGPNGSHDRIPEDGAYPMRSSAGIGPVTNAPRRLIPLGNSNGGGSHIPTTKLPTQDKPEPEKKKGGWLKRRFSKKE